MHLPDALCFPQVSRDTDPFLLPTLWTAYCQFSDKFCENAHALYYIWHILLVSRSVPTLAGPCTPPPENCKTGRPATLLCETRWKHLPPGGSHGVQTHSVLPAGGSTVEDGCPVRPAGRHSLWAAGCPVRPAGAAQSVGCRLRLEILRAVSARRRVSHRNWRGERGWVCP